MNTNVGPSFWAILLGGFVMNNQCEAASLTTKDQQVEQHSADLWRTQHRLIDMHQHLDFSSEHLARAVKLMDAAGFGVVVNLGTGTATPGSNGSPSEFERNKKLADAEVQGRILHYMVLDYQGWDSSDWTDRAVKQIEEGHRLGAAGLKEFKRLGLYLKDQQGGLIPVDSPKLDAVWRRCGELHMPVSIHVADPKAFWLPFDSRNERWEELKDHKDWWFGDTNRYPAWKSLLEALVRVVARHPETTFVSVHFGNNAEELDWVDNALSNHPNLLVDLAARVPEIGRHSPVDVRQFFLKHQDRILLGTDFQVGNRLILGSSGNEPPPTDDDALVFFKKHWRWLETDDRNWAHMTPIQGAWTISSINLPTAVLRKIYFDNANKLLARSLPMPVIRAPHIASDFTPDGDVEKNVWRNVSPVWIDRITKDASALPEVSTTVKALWSDTSLYLSFLCPFTQLTMFDPPRFDQKRVSNGQPGQNLWDRDVVEAFINSDSQNLRHYAEFQVAPSNEHMDLKLELPQRDFAWNSGIISGVKINSSDQVWTCEMRIPLSSLSRNSPQPGTRWRLNLFRCDYAHKAFLAWNPTLSGTFHEPERFGVLEFNP
jgi:predicted TIM-barrel fold metal-dependent hydrolase